MLARTVTTVSNYTEIPPCSQPSRLRNFSGLPLACNIIIIIIISMLKVRRLLFFSFI